MKETMRCYLNVANRNNGVDGNFGTLAVLPNSCSSAAVSLNGWPHDVSRNELSRCLDSGMAKGMHGIEYVAAV